MMILTLNKNQFAYQGRQSTQHIEVGDYLSRHKFPGREDDSVLWLVVAVQVGTPKGVELLPFWGSSGRKTRQHQTFDALETWHRWRPVMEDQDEIKARVQ